jgi:hypothetical protein
MRLTDHRKTWRFTLNASPQQCVSAFAAAFDGSLGGPLLVRAKWSIEPGANGAIAVYQGRAGLIKGVTMLSSRASQEEDAAVGSQVSFEAELSSDGRTVCSMWLSSRATMLGFTADGRFFRPYMRKVQDSLAGLDPNLIVETS